MLFFSRLTQQKYIFLKNEGEFRVFSFMYRIHEIGNLSFYILHIADFIKNHCCPLKKRCEAHSKLKFNEL